MPMSWRGSSMLSGHSCKAVHLTSAARPGKPVFGTLVALLWRGEPVLGVIDQPISQERWLGVCGRPTTLNGAPGPISSPGWGA